MKNIKDISTIREGVNLQLISIKEVDTDYNDIDFWVMTSAYSGIENEGNKYKIYELQFSRNNEKMPPIIAIYNHTIDYTAGISYGSKGIDLLREVHELLNAYFEYIRKPLGYKIDKKCMLLNDLEKVRVKNYEISNDKKTGEVIIKIQTGRKEK